MEKFGLALAGLAPCLVLLLACTVLLRRPPHGEPFGEMILCFVFGILSVSVVGVLVSTLNQQSWRLAKHPLGYATYEAFALAAIPEELARLCVLRWRLGRRPSTLNGHRCLLLGAVVGLGFASVENSLYCINLGWTTVWERAITSVPFHAMAGAVVGYFAGLSVVRGRFWLALVGPAITAILHGVNNFNTKYLYAGASPAEGADLPTEGFGAWLITGWPSNIVVLVVSGVLVLFLSRLDWKQSS